MAQKTAVTSGNWSNANTWNPVGVPAATDAVIINPGITVTVDVANAQAASVQLNVIGTGLQTSSLVFNAASQLTVSGNFNFAEVADRPGIIDMTAGGTLRTAAFNTAITTGSNFIAGTGTLTLTGVTSLPNSLFATLNHLVIESGTTTITGNTQLTGDLNIQGGTINLSSYTITRSGATAGTVTLAAGSTLRVGATSGFPENFATYTLSPTSNVEFYGTTQPVRGITYGNLTLNGGAKTATGPITVMGNLVSNADINAASFTHNIYGDWTNTGNFNAGTGTIEFFGVTEQDMPGVTFNNLRNTNTTAAVVAKGDVTINGSYTSTSVLNTLDMATFRLIMPPTAVVNNTGNVKTQNTSATPLPLDMTWGSPTTGTVVYNAPNGAQTIVRGTYNNLQATHINGGTSTANGNIVIGGTIAATTANSVIDLATYQLSHLVVGGIGAQFNVGTIRTQNTSLQPLPSGRTWGGTVMYDAAAGGQKIVLGTYQNLSVNTSGTENTSASLVINGNLVTSASSIINMNQETITGSFNAAGNAGTIRTQAQTNAFPAGKTWGGTVVYDATSTTNGAQTIIDGNYYNLTISLDRGSNNNITLPAVLNVSGNLNFSAKLNGTGQFISPAGGTTFNFNGTTQNIAVTATTNGTPGNVYPFDQVIIAGGGTKTLANNTTINGSLTLTNGVLQSATAALLTLGTSATVTAPAMGTHTSYVSGPLRKLGSLAFTFPVGKSGVYAPVSIADPGANGDITVEYFRPQTAGNTYTAPLVRVSPCEYWSVAKNGGANSPAVTLSWSAASNCGSGAYVTDPASVRVAYYDGANWINAGNSATTGTAAMGTVTTAAATLASPYGLLTLASTSDVQNPLPVKFIAVNAVQLADGVRIDWKTATETNVDYYDVQRSVNATEFNSAGRVYATANNGGSASYSLMDASASGDVIYYRIKAADKDGKISYSNIVRVTRSKAQTKLEVYPNPVKGTTMSFAASGLAKGDYQLAVYDLAGRIVYTQKIMVMNNGITQTISLPGGLQKGTYHLRILGNNSSLSKSFILE